MLSRYGVCSRRQAVDLIIKGRVSVDNEVNTNLNTFVTYKNKIHVDGKLLKREPPKIWIFNKPKNILVTHSVSDERGRRTLGQILHDMGKPNLHYIGRLDYTSEGLLLLTNNPSIKRYLELPTNSFKRKYRARVFGNISNNLIEKLKKGVRIDNISYKGIEIEIEKKAGANTWIFITLEEGKNREIRKVLKHFNIEVSRLIRIEYGPYKLNDLREGDALKVPLKPEITEYLESVGEI